MQREHWITPVLEEIRERGLERRPECFIPGDENSCLLNFSGNDYLNLAANPQVRQAAVDAVSSAGTASSASRLLTGTLSCHLKLEEELALFLGCRSSLVFGSGYLANLGVISTLAGRGDVVFADKYVHATLIDGSVLSRARFCRFKHNDASHLEMLLSREHEKRRANSRFVVVTESVFSMDGDCAPLTEITQLAERYDAICIVDEAHAIGVFGPYGAGGVAENGLRGAVNVCTGTLSKALASYGGFAACSQDIKELMVNRARPFIYNTSPPPAVIEAARAALKIIRSRPELGAELKTRAAVFREALRCGGLNVMNADSQIIPVFVGDNRLALKFAARLRERGIIAVAIRPPTVPAGSSRIRFSVTTAHSIDELKYAAGIISDEAKQLRVI